MRRTVDSKKAIWPREKTTKETNCAMLEQGRYRGPSDYAISRLARIRISKLARPPLPANSVFPLPPLLLIITTKLPTQSAYTHET